MIRINLSFKKNIFRLFIVILLFNAVYDLTTGIIKGWNSVNDTQKSPHLVIK
jgi:hypothetical protein